MAIKDDDYFDSKRPWAAIKNGILGYYLKPYVQKIARRGQPLLFIDAFAGPGKNFEDNSPGSPLLICNAASRSKVQWKAHFFNKKISHHDHLTEILEAGGWSKNAFTHLGDAVDLLAAVSTMINNESVFLYLDPFGLTFKFDDLLPFLTRNNKYSTEILINLNVSGLHRLAMRNAIKNGTADPNQVTQSHDLLTKVLGGDYWKEPLLSDDFEEAKEREEVVVQGYMEKLRSTGYLSYTGSCPVQEKLSSATKYHMIFASPHIDAIVIMNDAMCNAFNSYMHEVENPLFAFNGQNWKEWRDTKELAKIVVKYVTSNPKQTRENLWKIIVQDHFMRFRRSEYRTVVKELVNSNSIICSTPIGSKIRKTKRLNDNCVLEPKT